MATKVTKTTGIEPYVIECICLRLHEKEALSYLSGRGYDISAKEYYRIKQEVKESSHKRLNLIASEGFVLQHLERIETLNTIHTELWENYKKETNPTKRSNILMQIAEIQQYLASFYDSTQYVMNQSALLRKKRKLEDNQQEE
jgi:hypothetical protein